MFYSLSRRAFIFTYYDTITPVLSLRILTQFARFRSFFSTTSTFPHWNLQFSFANAYQGLEIEHSGKDQLHESSLVTIDVQVSPGAVQASSPLVLRSQPSENTSNARVIGEQTDKSSFSISETNKMEGEDARQREERLRMLQLVSAPSAVTVYLSAMFADSTIIGRPRY